MYVGFSLMELLCLSFAECMSGVKSALYEEYSPRLRLTAQRLALCCRCFFFFFVICFLNKDDPVFIYDLVKLGTAFCLPLCLYKSLLTVIMVLLLLHYIQ